jgi:hypothetical protein
MDALTLLLYFGAPTTIGVIGLVGLKLHERSAPPIEPETPDLKSGSWSFANGLAVSSTSHLNTPTYDYHHSYLRDSVEVQQSTQGSGAAEENTQPAAGEGTIMASPHRFR